MTQPAKPSGPGLRYIMNTCEDDKCVLTELRARMDDAENSIRRWVTDTRDTQTRQALANLGWIAPDANLQDAVLARCARCQHSGINTDCFSTCFGCIGHIPSQDRFKEKK